MAIELTCMNCWSQFSTEDRDRGRTIHCPVCDAEINVPGSPQPVDAADAPAADAALLVDVPVNPETPAADTTPLPAAPVVPRAKPVMAKPVKAAPVATSGTRDSEKKSGDVPFRFDAASGGSASKSSRRRRDEEDDEDEEDDDRRPAKKKGGSKALPILGIVFLCLLIFCVAPVGVFAWRVYSAVNEFDRMAANGEFDANIPEDDVAIDPAEMFPPKVMTLPANRATPPTKKSVARSDWRKPRDVFPPAADRAKEGFQVLMPRDTRSSRSGTLVDGKAVQSLTYIAEEGGVDYRAEMFDVPGEMTLDAETFVRRLLQNQAQVSPGAKPITLFNRPGIELTATRNGRTPESIRAARVGNKIFVFAIHHDPDKLKDYLGQNIDSAKTLFYSSAMVTFNPNVTSPPALIPKNPVTARPPVTQPAAPRGLRYVAKIEPFSVAVALPEKKEVLTFSAAGSLPPNAVPPKGGVVRRYSAESFKQLDSFSLANTAVYAAAADEKAGRLYLAVARTAAPGTKASAAIPAGELRVYDLKEFTAGGDAPKPIASTLLGGGPVALDIAPDGSAVYVAAVTAIPNPRARSGRTKLIKFDPKTTTSAAELDLTAVVTALRTSPDGMSVFAGESPAPPLGAAATPPGNVTVIDAASWKRMYGVPIPQGVVTDIQFVANNKAVVGAAKTGNEVKLYLVDAAGEATDLPTVPRFSASGFLAVSPDRQRLVTAVGGGAVGVTGTEVFSVGPGGSALRSTATMPLAPGGMLSGPIILTGNAAHAFYGSGIILDLAGTVEKP